MRYTFINHQFRIKIFLYSLIFSQYRLVRAMTNCRRRTMLIWERLPEAGGNNQFGDNKTEKLLYETALVQDFVINKMLLPLLQYKDAESFENIGEYKVFEEFDKDKLKEALLIGQEDTNLLIRQHYHHLRKLPRQDLPGAGKLRAKEWLVFLLLFEKVQARILGIEC